ncbi:MAG: hypothetical protein AAGA96_16950 [Verrucomicrobiota bacterium]
MKNEIAWFSHPRIAETLSVRFTECGTGSHSSQFMKATTLIALLSAYLLGSSPAAEVDTYGGFTDIKGEKTGFFHVEKINGRWWLVTPEGNAFWGIGIAHPITDFTESAVTFVYDGDQEAWLNGSIQKMRDLGYNCVWTGPYCPERLSTGYVDRELAERVFSEAKIPYAFPLPILKHRVEMAPGEKRPDVFDDSYTTFVEELVSKYVPKLKDDPWIMGYYYGFAPWMDDVVWPNDLIERKGSPGRERLIGVLEDRYEGDIERFNQVYQTSFESFEQLKATGSIVYPEWIKRHKMGFVPMPENPGSQELFDDAQALLGEIVEHTYRLAHGAIRKHDKNHLILGCYIKEASLTVDHWKRIGPYIDVLTPQHVSRVFPIDPVVEALDKPVLISDQPFGNVYPVPLITAKNAPGAVPDHVDRLVLYDLLANRISRDPNYIGVDFCAVLYDQSHEDKAYEIGQPGFYTKYGEPKDQLCRTVIHFNEEMIDNLAKPLDLEEVAALDEKFHETLARYRAVMRDRKDFLLRRPAVSRP